MEDSTETEVAQIEFDTGGGEKNAHPEYVFDRTIFPPDPPASMLAPSSKRPRTKMSVFFRTACLTPLDSNTEAGGQGGQVVNNNSLAKMSVFFAPTGTLTSTKAI